MRPKRLQAVGRALAWSSPALFAAFALAAVTIPAEASGSDWFEPLLLTLLYAAVIAGLAGVVVSVLAASRSHGRERRAAIRAAALAAVVPLLFA
ncbi:MAG: hypothetical protein ACYC1P_13955, partial [Gaiellaceae bacterium]